MRVRVRVRVLPLASREEAAVCAGFCADVCLRGYLRAAGAQAPDPELRSPQDLPGLDSQRESLEQPFLSVFKRGRRRVPVRSLGKVVHYAKVQLRFQHSQVGTRRGARGARAPPAAGPQLLRPALAPPGRQRLLSGAVPLPPVLPGARPRRAHFPGAGHAQRGKAPGEAGPLPPGSPAQPSPVLWQGLLPLMELSVGPLEGSAEPAFQVTGVWGTGAGPGLPQGREHGARACLFLRRHTSTCQAAGRTAGRGPPELHLWPRHWPAVLAGAIGSSQGLCAAPAGASRVGRPPSAPCPPPTGPLPAPLLVLCPSPAERDRWLYYLEKQMALAGGLRRCNSAPPQVSA